jgi:hypothetical protein
LDGGHGVCSFSIREASDTPRMIEHPCPFYIRMYSLLARALSATCIHIDNDENLLLSPKERSKA